MIGPGTHRGVKTHARRFVVHHPDLLALMDKSPPPKGKKGRPTKEQKVNASRVAFTTGHDRSRHTEVLAARLATEHPEHYEGFRNGTYKSVRAAVAIGMAIEATLPKPEERMSEAGKNGGKTAGKGRKKVRGSKSFTTPNQDNSKRTSAIAAAAVGLSARTYEKAKEVVEAAPEATARGRDNRRQELWLSFGSSQ